MIGAPVEMAKSKQKTVDKIPAKAKGKEKAADALQKGKKRWRMRHQRRRMEKGDARCSLTY